MKRIAPFAAGRLSAVRQRLADRPKEGQSDPRLPTRAAEGPGESITGVVVEYGQGSRFALTWNEQRRGDVASLRRSVMVEKQSADSDGSTRIDAGPEAGEAASAEQGSKSPQEILLPHRGRRRTIGPDGNERYQ